VPEPLAEALTSPTPVEQAPLPFAPEPAPVATAAATPVQAPPPADLPQIARMPSPDSGLELVETRHHAPESIAEEAEPPRPKRVRPPRAQVAEEPLQIIETRKEPTPPAP
jgi:hypothetical protein